MTGVQTCALPISTGVPPTAKQVKEIAATKGWNANNASIEYYQWRKYEGISGRVKAAPAQAEAEVEQTKMSPFWLQRKDGEYDGLHFMDDFGFLVPIDFKALAIHLQEEGK